MAQDSRFKFVIGERCCSRCRQQKSSLTGSFEVFNHGLNHRWICHDCKPKDLENRSDK